MTSWPATRVRNFVRMYYTQYMRDGEDAMPLKMPRMCREEGIVFLARRLGVTTVEFEKMNPFITAKILFEPQTILYNTEKVMNYIYAHLFGRKYFLVIDY